MLVRVGSLRATRQNGGPLRLADGTVAALDLQLANGSAYINGASVSLASVVACSRASTGYAETASGLLTSFAADTLRRTDKGLLPELASTNVLNSAMTGADVGTNTVPTGWSAANPIDSLTRTVVGTGTESGRPYVDIRWNGTSGAAGTTSMVIFNGNTTAALNTETWTASLDAALVGGSLTNVATMVLTLRYNNAGGTQLTSGTVSLTGVAATRTPYAVTATASDATTAWVMMTVVVNFTNTSAVDFTLRFYVPQLEKSPVRTSPIIGAANTLRSADVITMTGTNFTDWFNPVAGTFFAEWTTNATSGDNAVLFASDGTNNNRVGHYISSATRIITSRYVSGGSATNPGTIAGAITVGSSNKSATAYAVGASQAITCLNGTLSTAASPAADLTAATTLNIGSAFGLSQINGYLRRLSYFNTRVANALMQGQTT